MRFTPLTECEADDCETLTDRRLCRFCRKKQGKTPSLPAVSPRQRKVSHARERIRYDQED